jgi:hypothetical protein
MTCKLQSREFSKISDDSWKKEIQVFRERALLIADFSHNCSSANPGTPLAMTLHEVEKNIESKIGESNGQRIRISDDSIFSRGWNVRRPRCADIEE